MKVSFDLDSIKSFCVQHAEKFVFAGVILGLVFFAYGATRVPTVDFAPNDLNTAAENARKHWEGTPVGEYLDKNDLRARGYGEIADQIRHPIKPDWYAPKDKPWILRHPISDERGKRREPQLYPVTELRATAGHGLLAVGGGRGPTATIPAGWRWVVLTGLLPIADQLKEYEDALGGAPSERPEQDLPMYWGYWVQRAELGSLGGAGQLEWKALDWRRSWIVTRLYRGSSPQLVHPIFLPRQPSGSVPLVFPLGPLARAEWGNEVAHPPQIPLLADMPQPERRPIGVPPGFEGLIPMPDESDEGEADEGEDQFPGFPGFRGFPGAGDYGDYESEEYDDSGMPYMGASPLGRMPFAGPGGRFPPMAFPGTPGDPLAGPQAPFATAQPPYGEEAPGPGALTPLEQQIEHQLFRFFDFSVQPGKRYQYKVQLVLYNPNFRVHVQFLDPEIPDERPWVTTDWSDQSNTVYVPRDSRLLVGPVKPGRITTEPVANVVAVTFRTQDGLETGGDFTVERGQLANLQGTLAAQPRTGAYGDSGYYEPDEGYDEPQYDEEAAEPYRRPGVQEPEGEKILHETGMLVLDIDGGDRLHRTDRALTEPGSLLLLDPDGNLVVRRETDDVDEFLVYHVPEEEKRPKRPKEEGEYGYDEDAGYSDYDLFDEDDAGARRGTRRRRPRRGYESDDY